MLKIKTLTTEILEIQLVNGSFNDYLNVGSNNIEIRVIINNSNELVTLKINNVKMGEIAAFKLIESIFHVSMN